MQQDRLHGSLPTGLSFLFLSGKDDNDKKGYKQGRWGERRILNDQDILH